MAFFFSVTRNLMLNAVFRWAGKVKKLNISVTTSNDNSSNGVIIKISWSSLT